MAKIGIENIKETRLVKIAEERTHESGDIHPLVRDMYVEKAYLQKPNNGLMSSFPKIEVEETSDGAVVIATIAPTRYLIGEAMRDVMKKGTATLDMVPQLSPDMANVSVVCPVKVDGGYALVAQIKGEKVLGGGAIHAGISAGNIDGKYVREDADPMIRALKKEILGELGIDASALEPSAFAYMVDERETGQVNFAAVAQGQNLSQILEAFGRITTPKMFDGKPEVEGLAIIPFGAQLGASGKLETLCYIPGKQGLTKHRQEREVRPYTQAWLNHLARPENQKKLLEKAGF